MNGTRGKLRGISGSANWKELAAVQAANEENRGGGERGSNGLNGIRDEGRATKGSEALEKGTVTRAGSTKMAEATAGLSGFWQQDMLHWAMAAIS